MSYSLIIQILEIVENGLTNSWKEIEVPGENKSAN
jgi:hypothetical protein